MRILIAFLVLSGGLSATAQNTYLAYDALSSAAGVPLHNTFGGTGWNAPWDVQGAPSAGYVFSGSPLSWSSVQTYGGSCDGGYAYLTAGRFLDYDDGGAFDDYVTGGNLIGSTTGTTLYSSALLQKKTNDGERVFVALHNNHVDWCEPCTNNKVSFGYFGAAPDGNGVRYWALRIGATEYPTNVPVVAGQTAFFVLKIRFNAASTDFDLFVNPSSLGMAGEPAVPTLTQSTADLIRLRAVALYLGSTSGRGAVDEIRFADSYAVAAPDPSVVLNLPPTGSFTLSQTAGEAPLTVSFDASASNDPEGQSLTYLWNFGDGTPAALGGATISHTFSGGLTGVLPVTLTVTDNTGQQHSPIQNLTLYRPGTTNFPCQSTVVSLQEAGCNTNTGRIRLTSGIAQSPVYTFQDAANNIIPATNTNEFHNLAPGTYSVTVTGSNSCIDTYTLTVHRDSSTCADWQPNKCRMAMGVNVSGMADWSREHALINRYRQVRSNIITFHSGSSWDTGMESQLTLDADGYPNQVPQATTASANTMVRYVISSENANLRANEQYVFLYDGTATFSINQVIINSTTPGRVLFTVPPVSGNIWIDINETPLGDHIRNFRLLKVEDEFVDLSANIFNATFLSRLSPFKAIRFMDWGATNASPHVSWANRKTVNERTYTGARGVPYEIMIALCNLTQKDIWICVPHAADDDYITQMATLFRDNLDPNLTVYLEYSNEMWNWLFTQTHWNNEHRPLNLSYGRAYSEKAMRVFRIWHTVYGAQSGRVKRVLGLQGGYNGLNEGILAQIPQNEWDLASPSHYFGLDHGSTGNPVLTSASTGEDVNTNARNAYFNSWLPTLKQDYRNIRVLGKKIVTYEGGQHYTNFQTVPYQQAMYDAQYLPSMYNLYSDMLDTIRTMGNQLAMAFTLSGIQESVYGSWGHLPDMYMSPPYTTTAPKYQVLIENSCLPFQGVQGESLPLELLVFDGKLEQDHTAYLYWETAHEQEVSHYVLERSFQGGAFEPIGEVAATNSSEGAMYSFYDRYLQPGVWYYRLRIVEENGNGHFSHTVTLNVSGSSKVRIFPNPVQSELFIDMQATSTIPVRIYSALGRLVGEYASDVTRIDCSAWPAGVYVAEVGGAVIRIIKE